MAVLGPPILWPIYAMGGVLMAVIIALIIEQLNNAFWNFIAWAKALHR